MASKYIQLPLLWTVAHISKSIVQRYKNLTKSEKWLINNPSILGLDGLTSDDPTADYTLEGDGSQNIKISDITFDFHPGMGTRFTFHFLLDNDDNYVPYTNDNTNSGIFIPLKRQINTV